MTGCTATSATRVETTPAQRLDWLRGEVARAEVLTQLRGSYMPRGLPGAHIVCSLAIEIEAWYGVGDERWELSNADIASQLMTPVRPSSSMREELARIGIRDCVLDINR